MTSYNPKSSELTSDSANYGFNILNAMAKIHHSLRNENWFMNYDFDTIILLLFEKPYTSRVLFWYDGIIDWLGVVSSFGE